LSGNLEIPARRKVLLQFGRGNQSRELRQVAHTFKEISVGLLYRCLFPRNVLDGDGRVLARSPAKYQ